MRCLLNDALACKLAPCEVKIKANTLHIRPERGGLPIDLFLFNTAYRTPQQINAKPCNSDPYMNRYVYTIPSAKAPHETHDDTALSLYDQELIACAVRLTKSLFCLAARHLGQNHRRRLPGFLLEVALSAKYQDLCKRKEAATATFPSELLLWSPHIQGLDPRITDAVYSTMKDIRIRVFPRAHPNDPNRRIVHDRTISAARHLAEVIISNWRVLLTEAVKDIEP